MSSVGLFVRTPPRKRAAPVEIVESPDLPATPLNLPSLRSPIDSQSVPELDWEDTPQSRDDFPLTPASIASPSDIYTTPSHIHSTKIKPVKQCASAWPRRILVATPPKSHTSTERHLCVDGCATHKPRLLFPPSLFPASAGEKTGNSGFSHLSNIDFDRSFNFSSQSKRAHRDGLRSSLGSTWVELAAAKGRQSIGTQQEPARKKAKDEPSKISVKAEYHTLTTTLAQAVSIKAEDDLERSQTYVGFGRREEKIHLQQSTSTGTRVIGSAIKSVTIRRFSRILPFTTIERLIEDPGRCVASLVRETDRRCLKRIKSLVVTEAWLLKKLSRLEAPSDLAAAETYIWELVNMVTCTGGSHRSIAAEQFERLLSCSDERRRRGAKIPRSEHDFSRADMDALPAWLEALTRVPAGPKNGPVQLVQQTHASREDSESPGTSQLWPSSPPVSINAAHTINEATRTTEATPIIKTTQTIEANPTTEAAQTTINATPIIKITQTLEASSTTEAAQATEVTQTIETTQAIEASSTTEAAQTTEVTQTIETTPMTEVGPIIKATQAIEVTPTIEATPILKTTQTIEVTPTNEVTEATQTTEANPIIKTTQIIGAGPAIEVTQTTETTQTTQATQTTETTQTTQATQTTETTPIIKTTQIIEVTPTDEATQTTEVGLIIKTTQITEATQIPKATQTIEATPIIKITQTIEATQTAEARQTFDATQIIDVSILKPSSKSSTENQDRRLRKQVVVTQVQFLRSLNQNFEPYSPKSSRNLSVEDWIHDRLFRPLTRREVKVEGLIYMYWGLGNFGFVKIGMTSRKTTAQRLKEWEKQCGHKLEEHVGGEVETVVRLPHVYRVEALVHAELKDMRIREIKCQKCGKTHREWFNVSPDHAKKVIKKWSDWMVTGGRYEYNRGWRLKNTMSDDEIMALCRPTKGEHAAPPPALRRSSRLEAARRMGGQGRKNS